MARLKEKHFWCDLDTGGRDPDKARNANIYSVYKPESIQLFKSI